jgi:hypothetical protein
LVNQIAAHVKGKSFLLPARQRMEDPPPRGSPNRVNPGIVPPDSASFVFNAQLAGDANPYPLSHHITISRTDPFPASFMTPIKSVTAHLFVAHSML